MMRSFTRSCRRWERDPGPPKGCPAAVKISEGEVYSHLEHIRRSITPSGRHLFITPAECKKCGCELAKRERLKKPGKCPVCKAESIHEPLFEIKNARPRRLDYFSQNRNVQNEKRILSCISVRVY
jgi:predicted Zn-ribbon and HTH transcriptional regulator